MLRRRSQQVPVTLLYQPRPGLWSVGRGGLVFFGMLLTILARTLLSIALAASAVAAAWVLLVPSHVHIPAVADLTHARVFTVPAPPHHLLLLCAIAVGLTFLLRVLGAAILTTATYARRY